MNLKNIFVALTPYQLFVSYIYAKYIHDIYNCDNTIIYQHSAGIDIRLDDVAISFIEVPNLNECLKGKIWQRLYYSGILFYFSPLGKVVNSKFAINLFIFNDYYPISNNLMKIISKGVDNTITIIEEGVGMYAISEKRGLSLKDYGRLVFTALLGAPMVFRAIAESKEIQYAIVDNIPLYNKKKSAKNQTVLQQHKKKLLAQSSLFIKAVSEDFDIKVDANMLYIGQPLAGIVHNRDLEYEYLIKLFSPLVENGLKVVIKPHPREDLKKYYRICNELTNIELLNGLFQTLPVECLIKAIGVKMVCTFFSSAAVNIANIYSDISVFMTYAMDISKSINDWRDNHNNNPMYYDKKNILRSCYNNIFFIANMEDLLGKITQKKLLIEDDKFKENEDIHFVKGMFSEIDTIMKRI